MAYLSIEMKKEDIKIGQKVSFYYSGSKFPNNIGGKGCARVVNGVVYKIHRVNIEIEEDLDSGYCLFYKKPSELTIDKRGNNEK